jgi:broad specificity phosphatase PhoE
MNRLFLVRHGENPANLTKEFSCKLVDYSLTAKGVLQAKQTAEYLQDKDIHEIYSSPLKRAVETAELIATPHGLQVVVMANLAEVNVGDLERQPPSAETWALHNSILANWLGGRREVTFPGGENYVTLWHRVRTGLERIVAGKDRRNIVVVAHGGIFTLTLKDLCRDIDTAWLYTAANHNCSITEIEVQTRDGQIEGRLIQWASYAHLHGAAANLISGVPRAGDQFGEPAEQRLDSTKSRVPW